MVIEIPWGILEAAIHRCYQDLTPQEVRTLDGRVWKLSVVDKGCTIRLEEVQGTD